MIAGSLVLVQAKWHVEASTTTDEQIKRDATRYVTCLKTKLIGSDKEK